MPSERPATAPRVRTLTTVVLVATLLVPYSPVVLAFGPPAPASEGPSADDGPTGVALIFVLGILLVGGAALVALIMCIAGAALERSAPPVAVPSRDDPALRGRAALQRWHRSTGLVLVAAVAVFGAGELVSAVAVLAGLPWAVGWPVLLLPGGTATVAVFGFWWSAIMRRRRRIGLPAAERGALLAAIGDAHALRRVAAPVRALTFSLIAAAVGFAALIVAGFLVLGVGGPR